MAKASRRVSNAKSPTLFDTEPTEATTAANVAPSPAPTQGAKQIRAATTAALPPRRFQHVVIRASAGSGKTFQLSNRYLALLHAGVSPEKILAVTFTRKAAGEIFDRIVLRLADAAADDAKRAELAEHIGDRSLSAERCRELLLGVTRTLDRLRIGTLDSFFSKIAGSCSMELGLPLGWKLVEEIDDLRLRDRAIADSLTGDGKARVLTLLSLLTKGEATRGVSQMIRNTVNELHTAVRETDPPAWQRVPRVAGLTPEELADTFQRLQSLPHPDKVFGNAFTTDIALVEAGDWLKFIGKGLAVKIIEGVEVFNRKPISSEALAIYESLLRHAKHELLNHVANQTEATHGLLTHFHEHYAAQQHAHAALRFNDITLTLARAAVADDERVSFRLDAAIDHLLLDEFQDTSLTQWQVLRPIAQRVAKSPHDTSFFCVGDVKQAIYGWRGGLAELFDAVQQELPDLEQRPLDTSYRSSLAVIDVVNQVFSRLDIHPNLEKYASGVLKWQQQFNPHTTTRTSLAGYVTLEAAPTADDSEAIATTSTSTADDEATDLKGAFLDFVSQRIATAYQAHPGCTIGVLTRTNAAIGQIIYRLRALGIPASEEGGNPLVDSAAVELILSCLRLADHPSDRAAAFHVARSPLGQLVGIGSDHDSSLPQVAAQFRRDLLDRGYGSAIDRWCRLLAPYCDARDRSRLQQLVEAAYSYQSQSTLRTDDFLEFIETKRVADPTTSAVRVMTVHQAKGLEFDVVILPELDSPRSLMSQTPPIVTSRSSIGGDVDLVCRYAKEEVQKLLPPSFAKMFNSTIEAQVSESLCVLYVSLTRAVHALHMLIKPLKEKEKALPKTSAGLVRAALCDESSPRQGILFSHGAANWFDLEQQRRHRTTTPPVVATAAPIPTIVLAPPQARRQRGLSRESPSRLEGGSGARLRRALELSDPQRERAMLRGTVFHAWFELVQWLNENDSTAPSPTQQQLLDAFAVIRGVEFISIEDRDAWLAEFQAMLARADTPRLLRLSTYTSTLPKSWHKLLGNDVQSVARNEWPFAVIEAGQLLQGRMDRVVFLQRGEQPIAADVIDYKTDVLSSSPGGTLEERVAHYRPQVDAYCRTLAQHSGLPRERVTAGLLFVSTGQLWRPAETGAQT